MRPHGKVPPGRREAALASVEDEIRGERARALARAVRQLESALEALGAAGPVPRRGRATRDELLADAAERLWYVVIQREALGLGRHEEFLRDLGVPGEVVARMGPRRSTPPSRGSSPG